MRSVIALPAFAKLAFSKEALTMNRLDPLFFISVPMIGLRSQLIVIAVSIIVFGRCCARIAGQLTSSAML